MYRTVVHLVVLARTAGYHDDFRVRYVGQGRRRGQDHAAFLVRDGPGTFGDEDRLRAGQRAEHLVGTDRVEHGEPVEQQDGNPHDTS